jgi:hypothetical protein
MLVSVLLMLIFPTLASAASYAVYFKTEGPESAHRTLLERHDAIITEYLPKKDSVFGATLAFVEISPDNAKALRKSGQTTRVEWMPPVKPLSLYDPPSHWPNDMYVSQQWYYPMMGADRAREAGIDGSGSGPLPGRKITIAVIDTGVNYEHRDMIGADIVKGPDYSFASCTPDLVPLPSYCQGNYADDNTLTSNPLDHPLATNATPLDVHGHGTGMASILVAQPNNTHDIAGIAPGVRIVAINAWGANHSPSTSSYAAAINHLLQYPSEVDIITISMGGFGSTYTFDQALKAARDAGILVICGAGNSGSAGFAWSHPQNTDYCYNVGAHKSNGEIANFSSTGDVDLVAPGLFLRSLTPSPNNTGASIIAGTSYAGPLAAGAAALVWSQYPNWTGEQVMQRLEDTATDLGPAGWDDHYGHGAISITRALALSEDYTPLICRDSTVTVPANTDSSIPVDCGYAGTHTWCTALNGATNISFGCLANDNPFAVDVSKQPDNGILLNKPDESNIDHNHDYTTTLQYRPSSGFSGQDTVVIHAQDPRQRTLSRIITINVEPTRAVQETLTCSVNPATVTILQQATLRPQCTTNLGNPININSAQAAKSGDAWVYTPSAVGLHTISFTANTSLTSQNFSTTVRVTKTTPALKLYLKKGCGSLARPCSYRRSVKAISLNISQNTSVNLSCRVTNLKYGNRRWNVIKSQTMSIGKRNVNMPKTTGRYQAKVSCKETAKTLSRVATIYYRVS